MNVTPKVKSNSKLRNRCRRNSTATRSARLRIVPSNPAAGSVAHTSSSCRWSPLAAAPASSRRRQPDTVPDVVALPRSTRSQRGTVAPTSRQLTTLPDEGICHFVQYRTQRLMTVTDASEADPVRRTSRGQRDTVQSVTPVNSRRIERDTVTDIAPANSTHRSVSGRLETTYAVPARPRRGSVRRPTTSHHSMGPRDSNVVDLPELRSHQYTQIRFSAPHLANIRHSDLYELLDCNMAILEFIRREAPTPLRPFRLPTPLFDRLMSASRNVNFFGVNEMTEEEICRLPVRKVPNSAIPSQPCSICLKDYERGDVLRVMPCHHEFHQKCLDQWLAIKRNCPVCRNAL